MTMPDVARRAGPFTGNGVLTQLPFTFQVQEAADVAVWTYSTVTGLSTPLLLNIGFGVTLNSDQISNPGGVVGLVTPLATGLTATVVGGTAFEQPLRIPNMSSFYPEALTAELDKLTIITQILREALNYTVRVPEGSGIDALTYLQTLVNNTVPVVGTAVAVASISALRANTDATLSTVNVLGYYGAGTPGGGVFVKATADTTSSDNGGTVIIDAGNRRWYRQGWVEYNVVQFGARGDGSTDDTVAVQAAISACGAAGGGVVRSPQGNFRITGTLTVTTSGVRFLGSGRWTTVYTFANGVADCLVYSNGTTYLYGGEIAYMRFAHTSKTGGRSIFLSYVADTRIHDIQISGPWNGIQIYVTNQVYLNDLTITEPQNTSGYAILWNAPSDGSARCDVLNVTNVSIDCNYTGADGVRWDGMAHTLSWYGGAILRARYGVLIQNTGGSVSNVPNFLESVFLAVEGAKINAVKIEGGTHFRFIDALLTNIHGGTNQGNSDTAALWIEDDVAASYVSAIKLIGCRIGLSARQAVYCKARSVQFIGCTFPTGGMAASNTYAAVELAAPAQDILLSGNMDAEWGSQNNYRYGLLVGAGVARVTAVGNFFYNALTRPIQNNSTDFVSTVALNGTTQDQHSTNWKVLPNSNSSGAGTTLTAAQIIGGVLSRSGPGVNFVDTLPTAAAIVAAATEPGVRGSSMILLINGSAVQWTLSPGVGVTFAGQTSGGNFVIAAGASRYLTLSIVNPAAGTEAVTIYG